MRRLLFLAALAAFRGDLPIPPVAAETVSVAWRSASDQFYGPWAVSVNPTDGSCWVADGAALVHLSAAGTELWRSASGAYLNPLAVSVNPGDSSCWMGDASEIVHLSVAGVELWRSASGTYSQADVTVSVNPTDGSCWAARRDTGDVVHLSASGAEVSRSASGVLTDPRCVSANPTDGSCWVADSGPLAGSPSSAVVHLSAAGDELSRWTGGKDSYPFSVSVNPTDGSCWAADQNAGVVHLSAAGEELRRSADGAFLWPNAVSVNPTDGSCWVADEGGEIVHLSVGGEELSRLAGTTRSYWAGALSVDLTDGSCWVADWHGGQALKLAVAESSPSADFSGAPTSGAAPLTVQFTDGSSGGPAFSWQWDFGDGTTSTQQNPTHEYAGPGLYAVSLTARNYGGSSTKAKPQYVLVTFQDVPLDDWALSEILACVDAKIVAGYPDGTYQPTNPVTRDQMAVYVSRALAGGDAKIPTSYAVASFPDVPVDYWAFKYVEYAKAHSIVSGYPDGTYQPANPVDRGQMAVYIARAIADPTGDAGLANYTPPMTASFPDAGTDFYAYKYIEYIKSKDITGGYPDGDYHPEIVVSRDQMAVYVARAFGLT